MRDIETMKAELKGLSTEERDKFFERLLKEFDHAEELNDRKHCREERRVDCEMSALDMSHMRTRIPDKFKELSHSDNWLDVIFSQRSEDLHELMTDDELIKAVKGLSEKRKEVLFYRAVWKYSTTETAAALGVSDRNVRKLYARAIKEIHDKILNKD